MKKLPIKRTAIRQNTPILLFFIDLPPPWRRHKFFLLPTLCLFSLYRKNSFSEREKCDILLEEFFCEVKK
jgi:hypothetical protein